MADVSDIAFGNDFRLKKINEWGELEIQQWIDSFGARYKQYASNFLENGVDGELLMDLTEDDLEDIGISSRLHRRVILSKIRGLKIQLVEEENVETSEVETTG